MLRRLPWRRTVRRARRSLLARWLLVALAAAVAAAQAVRLDAAAASARRAWGDAVPVVVAARDLDAGDVVGAGDLRADRWPRAVVPDGAVGEVPAGAVVSAGVVAGEVLVDARLAPAGLSPAAALVPDGWRAVAVPTGAGGFGTPAPPLAGGDVVDLLAPELVASGAVVVDVGDDAVTVAVRAADAPAVAEALSVAVVTIALRGSR